MLRKKKEGDQVQAQLTQHERVDLCDVRLKHIGFKGRNAGTKGIVSE